MTDKPNSCTAFSGERKLASGPARTVARKLKENLTTTEQQSVLVFDDASGRLRDLDLSGELEQVLARLEQPTEDAPRRRGRPKLGVVPKEVTLLPRHWDWLNAQPGGASVTLRKLVDNARHGKASNSQRQHQESCYRVMHALGGDRPGYEDALRALYADDLAEFRHAIDTWPRDIRNYLGRFADGAFTGPDEGAR
ncbi:DUF2239 family protein [Parahaliea maris]|uniref:DUF2239 family protein n=1 Tax=Parahaliea maris TaxID=2716870 RepID=A0A5C8ZYM0_9GAMM|nr:DUF2239 family protein [Parahaliea maris]TXS92899.1 DUF2239 family protein [Parahaliea maris]